MSSFHFQIIALKIHILNFYPLCHNFDQFSGEWQLCLLCAANGDVDGWKCSLLCAANGDVDGMKMQLCCVQQMGMLMGWKCSCVVCSKWGCWWDENAAVFVVCSKWGCWCSPTWCWRPGHVPRKSLFIMVDMLCVCKHIVLFSYVLWC